MLENFAIIRYFIVNGTRSYNWVKLGLVLNSTVAPTGLDILNISINCVILLGLHLVVLALLKLKSAQK